MIVVVSRRAPPATLASRFGASAVLLDLTSRGPEPWVRFSPFYPHGGIPVHFAPGTSASVEGIWHGLKVFERADVDPARFAITTTRGIKRSARPADSPRPSGRLLVTPPGAPVAARFAVLAPRPQTAIRPRRPPSFSLRPSVSSL